MTRAKLEPDEPPRLLDLPFVFVLWNDAVTDDGWEEAHQSEGPDQVWSTGFLLERTRKHVHLASDVGLETGHNRRITIPFQMILEIRLGSIDGEKKYERLHRKVEQKSKGEKGSAGIQGEKKGSG